MNGPLGIDLPLSSSATVPSFGGCGVPYIHFLMKKLLLLLIIAALGGGGLYAYKREWFGGMPKKPVTSMHDAIVAAAEVRDIEFSIQVSGDVRPATQLDVKPEVGGRLKKIHVLPGSKVKAGMLLVEIDDRDILSERESSLTEIEGAQLAVDKMVRNHARAKDLHEQKLISQEAFDNLTSELAIARNSLAKAERRKQLVEDKLSKTKVIAPGDGTVLTVPIVEGQVVISAASVNSGTTLMTIADLSRLVVETHVNQVDVAKLLLKQEVSLSAESIRDETLNAIITFIAPVATVKNAVKGFSVEAVIETASERLRPGMTVQMTVPIANAESVIAVPVGAVFKGEGNSRVVYVRDGDRTERRSVKIGVTNTEHAQILQGLKEGEQILLNEPARGEKRRS
jgi:RND family efflux transporter MFP subunit